jgi:MFS transporter, DHA1 family, multidrug resistance protein
MRLNIHSIGFTLFLAALSALPPLAIDTALPSLALIQADLDATQTEAASVIAIFLVGFATAPLAVGPLADRFGRKPVMLAGVSVFTLCALGCALAPSIGALLAFRLIQGVGAGAVGVLPRAIIRDLFEEGREARLHIAAVSLVFSMAPLLAPTLGAAILAVGPWRLIFFVLTGVGAALAAVALVLFKESHALDRRRNLRPATILAGYGRALTSPMCVGFALVNGLVFAGLFAYVNVSPLLFIEGYGVSKAAFAGLFAITASGVIVGSSINAWLIRRHARPKTVLDVSLALISRGGGDGLYLDLRPRFSQCRPRGGPSAPGHRGHRVRRPGNHANAVRRARRQRGRRALQPCLAARDRPGDELRRPLGRRVLRGLAEAEGRGVKTLEHQ